MFDLIFKLLSTVTSFLFPIFASYKALKGNDPAQLAPWLMYWVVLACALLAESWTEWLLVWLPFYTPLRFLLLLYLVLPQIQGARLIYQAHIHPFLAAHEAEIDTFISSAHDRVKEAGWTYLKQALEYVKVHLLDMQPKKTTSSAPASAYAGMTGGMNYAQALLARFNIPSARGAEAPPTAPTSSTSTDFYSLLTAALAQVNAATASNLTATPSATTPVPPPPSTHSPSNRLSYLAIQRERLRTLLLAVDHETSNLSSAASGQSTGVKGLTPQTQPINPFPSNPTASAPTATTSGFSPHPSNPDSSSVLRKSHSDAEFETVEREDVEGQSPGHGGEIPRKPVNRQKNARTSSGGWLPWKWGGSESSPPPQGMTGGDGLSASTTTSHVSESAGAEKERTLTPGSTPPGSPTRDEFSSS
ncbi:MAG: hypothetical protein M1817_002908 [Caeruleum heppii]|nr:MAG: hypothetical protein M1817_002908 [Caeruleum heppii]